MQWGESGIRWLDWTTSCYRCSYSTFSANLSCQSALKLNKLQRLEYPNKKHKKKYFRDDA